MTLAFARRAEWVKDCDRREQPGRVRSVSGASLMRVAKPGYLVFPKKDCERVALSLLLLSNSINKLSTGADVNLLNIKGS